MDPNIANDRPEEDVVIIGGGHAGAALAAHLRQIGHAAAITLVGDEDVLPYHRPPLSKAWLSTEPDPHSMLLRPADFYRAQMIDVRQGVRVTAVDRASRRVTLSDGDMLSYGHLVIATGARARLLPVPGQTLQGVLSLRQLQDAKALRTALGSARRLVVIGAGYIGLETAATARSLGIEVTVLERESRLLPRTASPVLSAHLEARHRTAGVHLLLSAPEVEAFQGRDGAVCGVTLTDGRTLPADIVLVGIGATPDDGLARDMGLLCDDGVLVDGSGRTSDARIFAIGDVSRRPLPQLGRTARLESIASANEQARAAACAISAQPAPAPEVPWFWSDQYDDKVQMAGLAWDVDRTVERPQADPRRLAVFHLRERRVVAVETINAPQEFLFGKKLIAAQRPVDPDRLADPSTPLKELLAAEAAAPVEVNRMISITFVLQDLSQRALSVEPGISLMELAVRNNLPGIAADCGGACSCGTCLVHLKGNGMALAGSVSEYETALLDFAENPSPQARLACQITISEAMDGLVVEIP